MKRFAQVFIVACVVSFVPFTYAQNYLTATGAPTFSAPEPVEYGFVESANGNLHLEFPMGSFPQRGSKQPYTVKLVYDSHIWQVQPFGNIWTPVTYSGNGVFFGAGFRFVESTWGQISSTQYSSSGCGADFTWTDATGTQHFFPLPNVYGSASSGCSTTGNAFATDSSGYHLYDNVSSTVPIDIYAPDGSLVFHGTSNGNGGEVDAQGNKIAAKDSNGNYLSLSPNSTKAPVDTLGRVPTLYTVFCNNSTTISCYDIANSQSSATLQADSLRSHYVMTGVTVAVKTAFGQSGITEANGNMNVLQSISLPDGSSYSFKYDCDSTLNSQACISPHGQAAYYGTLMRVTLPTGGQINYTYTTFSDSYSGKTRWLYSKSSAGGIWYYYPQVLTTCGSTSVGCQQKVTTYKPSGDTTVRTFTLDNGAWPVQEDTYAGGTTLLSSIKTTWDFAQPCVLHGCHGHNYIRKLAETTTVYGPGNSPLTKKSQFTYGTAQNGLVLVAKDWKYQPGASPVFPTIADRTTNIGYYAGGTNNINRPSSVTVCNATGSDADCPGGGTKVSRTLTTYDSYTGTLCGTSVLSSISGIANHDDTNFGTSYTTRGNPTQVQQWVNGSTYIATQLAYDTTGQVTRVRDPNGNCTSYSYTDNFYSDNGGNPPPSFAPTLPTNAYLTQVTLPTVGSATMTESFGYYFGSGKQARATDPNSQVSYSHYMDALDRPTGTKKPISWSLVAYTSPTQIDGYSPIADTTASAGCTSCRHTQITMDGWGRKTNTKLVNAPSGAINVDTVYGTQGRVASVSHPYVNVANRVYENLTYEGMDRVIATTHPDNQSSRKAYGPLVNNLGGLTTQQGATGTYGYGYPSIQLDEAGKQKQEWFDGFGNVIEVDEPSTGSGTPGSKVFTISFFSGDLTYTYDPCANHSIGSCPVTVTNNGTLTIVVNGFAASAGWGSTDTLSSVVGALVGQFNSPGSPVSATSSGGTITVTAIAPGASTNYSFTTSSTYNEQTCDTQPCFSGPAFTVSPTSGTFTGGTGGLGTSPYVTLYKYDVLGNLLQVVQGSQARTFAYDGLSRVTSAQLPEVSNVPAAGQQPQQCPISFTYDGNSNILTKTEPSPNQTSCTTTTTTYLCYDALDRRTGKAYTSQSCPMSSPVVSYSYDQGGAGANALGRLTSMNDSSGSETYSYDQEGRITQVQKVISGTTYTIAYQPNAAGELNQITYPSGRIVTQSYDAVGRLTGVASGGVNYTSSINYDAAGNILGFNYGNGVVAGFSYSSDRSQMTNLSYIKGAQTLLSLNYGYKNGQANCSTGTTTGNDGLVQCIQDVTGTAEAGRSVVYGYDSLARLTTAVTTGTTGYPKWGLSWTYDRYANRLTQAVTAGTAFSNTLGFAVLPGGTGAYTNRPDGYSFDAKGNMLNDGINTLTYDVENRIASSAGSGSGAYVYDGSNTRIKKCIPNCTTPSSTTVYVFAGSKDLAEYDNSAAPTSPSREYVYSGGRLVATLAGATTTYHHADHLSVRVNTDVSGNKVGEQGHYPYGEQWYLANTTTKFIYTSYERDSESGNDYAMARFYISRFGRFCSLDPVGGSPNDPQSWNRYTYARNNPISFVDPSGKSFLSWLGNAILNYVLGMSGIRNWKPYTPSNGPWSEQWPTAHSGPIPPGVIIDEGNFGIGPTVGMGFTSGVGNIFKNPCEKFSQSLVDRLYNFNKKQKFPKEYPQLLGLQMIADATNNVDEQGKPYSKNSPVGGFKPDLVTGNPSDPKHQLDQGGDVYRHILGSAGGIMAGPVGDVAFLGNLARDYGQKSSGRVESEAEFRDDAAGYRVGQSMLKTSLQGPSGNYADLYTQIVDILCF